MKKEDQIPDIILICPDEFLDEIIEKEVALFDNNNTKVAAINVP